MHTNSKKKKRLITNIMSSANTTNISITKRDGRKEPLDNNKLQFVVEEACEGLPGVTAAQI